MEEIKREIKLKWGRGARMQNALKVRMFRPYVWAKQLRIFLYTYLIFAILWEESMYYFPYTDEETKTQSIIQFAWFTNWVSGRDQTQIQAFSEYSVFHYQKAMIISSIPLSLEYIPLQMSSHSLRTG